ncbi:hypothetical protein NC653_027846 [Populus alba x Populus x berolinensis]|uniref:Nuclease associated modular domain-containing protein n=1 Tax=Populus alba x Populus x berolinensis TaxID=444605 RepID=A0AAD6M6V5_9ROSI|nr:hypothetical protein NC653_027846 [Populus alba x Populus x berolinensis]
MMQALVPKLFSSPLKKISNPQNVQTISVPSPSPSLTLLLELINLFMKFQFSRNDLSTGTLTHSLTRFLEQRQCIENSILSFVSFCLGILEDLFLEMGLLIQLNDLSSLLFSLAKFFEGLHQIDVMELVCSTSTMQPCLKQSFVANSGLCVGTHFQPNVQQSNHCNSIVMNTCPTYASISTFPRVYDSAALQISVDVRETTGSCKHFHSKISLDSAEKQTLIKEVQLDGYRDTAESIIDLPKKGKGKKKHGNKGRIPWNKGRKHTAETRALIKQRTTEALTNPQVKSFRDSDELSYFVYYSSFSSKTSSPSILTFRLGRRCQDIPMLIGSATTQVFQTENHNFQPIPCSEAIRAKISSSLRQIWGKRLKWKRLREKFFLSWSKSIARAAKEGGIDQQELDWDGFDGIKEEITLKQLQGAIEKAKAEERAKRTVEREAKEREEKMVRVAQKREKREEKVKAREEAKRKAYRESKKKTEESSSVARKLTLKRRLTKIRKRKSINDQMIRQGASSTSHSRAWEKIDVEIKKSEKFQREGSLAEHIRDAKNKRTESITREALAEPSTQHLYAG